MPAPLPIAFSAIQRQPQTVSLPRRRRPLNGLLLAVAGIIVVGFVTYRLSGPSGGRVAAREVLIKQVLTPEAGFTVFGYDMDKDGRTDSWTFLDGGHLVRTEVDENGDGEIDRWYYYDKNERVTKVETSSRAAGILDDAPPMVERSAE